MASLSSLLSSPPYLGRVIAISSHGIDDRIRHRTEDAERAFRAVVDGEAKSTNIGDTEPPEIPRITLKQGHKVIALAKDRSQLAMSFKRADVEVAVAYSVAQKNISSFIQGVQTLHGDRHSCEMAVIIEINYPSEAPPAELSEALARLFYSGPVLGEWASLEFRLGFMADGLFKNFGASLYELREGTLPVSPGLRRQRVDFSNLSVIERGVAIKLEVNNRPKLAGGDIPQDLKMEYEAVMGAMDRLFNDGYKKQFFETKQEHR